MDELTWVILGGVLLTIKEVVARLYGKVAAATIYEHVRKGKIPASKPFGRWLVDSVALEAYLAEKSNRTVATPEKEQPPPVADTDSKAAPRKPAKPPGKIQDFFDKVDRLW